MFWRIKTKTKKLLQELKKESLKLNRKIDYFLAPAHSQYFRSSFSTKPEHIYYSYRSLIRGKYIKERVTKKKKEIIITNRGRIAILGWQIQKKIQNKNWDGKWRIITFDVPEENKEDRYFLRENLKWLGLEELQKSVWISPHDIEKEFREFLKLCNRKLIGDVRFILAEKISSDKDLKKYFDI